MKNLKILPRFEDGLSFLFIEHCHIESEKKGICSITKEGKTQIPCAELAVLMLGPGSSITHKAIQILALNDCMVLWCGEHGVRFYAEGLGRTRRSKNLILQAKLVSNPNYRLEVVKRMYLFRFKEKILPTTTLQQFRGKEGYRVKMAYKNASDKYNVSWNGRNYDRSDWSKADPVNRALSTANTCLYGICHAAIIAAGFSPGLGFIHSGLALSFVYDIADLYKVDLIIPLAFQLVAKNPHNIERRTRYVCREIFYKSKLLK